MVENGIKCTPSVESCLNNLSREYWKLEKGGNRPEWLSRWIPRSGHNLIPVLDQSVVMQQAESWETVLPCPWIPTRPLPKQLLTQKDGSRGNMTQFADGQEDHRLSTSRHHRARETGPVVTLSNFGSMHGYGGRLMAG